MYEIKKICSNTLVKRKAEKSHNHKKVEVIWQQMDYVNLLYAFSWVLLQSI